MLISTLSFKVQLYKPILLTQCKQHIMQLRIARIFKQKQDSLRIIFCIGRILNRLFSKSTVCIDLVCLKFMMAYFCPLHANQTMPTCNISMFICDLSMFICDLFMTICNLFMSTCNIIQVAYEQNYHTC